MLKSSHVARLTHPTSLAISLASCSAELIPTSPWRTTCILWKLIRATVQKLGSLWQWTSMRGWKTSNNLNFVESTENTMPHCQKLLTSRAISDLNFNSDRMHGIKIRTSVFHCTVQEASSLATVLLVDAVREKGA